MKWHKGFAMLTATVVASVGFVFVTDAPAQVNNDCLPRPGRMIVGGPNNDVLIGTSGDDIILGGDGNDRIFGGDGNDILLGGSGADQMYGEGCHDRLGGDGGTDMGDGGSGTNICAVEAREKHDYGGILSFAYDYVTYPGPACGDPPPKSPPSASPSPTSATPGLLAANHR